MPDQCRAVTEGGERCSRPANENGFCHQHGPQNETVDEADTDEPSETDADDDREDTTMAEDTDSNETTDETESQEETESSDETGSSDETESTEESTIVTVRDKVRDDVPQLIGRELDGVTSLMQTEDGWMATVELVERRSVPDTQDLIGQYEVSIGDDAVIDGYRRLETYRRAEGPEYDT